MRVSVKVKPNFREEKIEKIGENNFIVCVKESAKDNKANFAVIKVLADYFDIAILRVRLVSGKNARNKIFDIS